MSCNFCKLSWYTCFCKELYFGYCNLFIRKDLLQRYLLKKIKNLVGHLQFIVRQKHNLVRYLILPQIFPVRQNIQFVFHLVCFSFFHCVMSDCCFKSWSGNMGHTVDIFTWTWIIWGSHIEHTSKQQKKVAFVRNCLVKVTLRLF